MEFLLLFDASSYILFNFRAILDGIDVNRYGSRFTLYLGSDGTNITTTRTDYLLDFHKFYNKTFHDSGKHSQKQNYVNDSQDKYVSILILEHHVMLINKNGLNKSGHFWDTKIN